MPVSAHNTAEAHSCVAIDTETSLVEQYPTVDKAVDRCKQLTNNFGSKRPALKYLSTVVYCLTSEIQYQTHLEHVVSHSFTNRCIGSLDDILVQDGCLPENVVWGLILQVAAGLQYLHNSGILYCDLRPSKVSECTGK